MYVGFKLSLSKQEDNALYILPHTAVVKFPSKYFFHVWYIIEPSHSFGVCFHARVVIEVWHSFGARVFHARMVLPAWHCFAVSILQWIVCIGNNHNSDGDTGNNLY